MNRTAKRTADKRQASLFAETGADLPLFSMTPEPARNDAPFVPAAIVEPAPQLPMFPDRDVPHIYEVIRDERTSGRVALHAARIPDLGSAAATLCNQRIWGYHMAAVGTITAYETETLTCESCRKSIARLAR